MELPISQPHVGILRDVCVKDGSNLVPSNVAATKCGWRLNCSFPGKYAVLVVRCVIAGVSRSDVVGKGRNATAVQLARCSEGNDNILNAAVRTGDRDSDSGYDRVHGCGVGVASEFEVVPTGDPVAGADVEVAFHAGRANAEALAAACGGTAAQRGRS